MDLNAFSKKFNSLLQECNTNCVKLEAETGIRSDKLRKFKSIPPSKPVYHSVDDLIALANHFHITLDELLCRKIQKPQEETSLADIIRFLFQIDESTDISIVEDQIEEITTGFGGYPETYDKTVYSLYFKEDFRYGSFLNDFMKEWEETKEYLRKTKSDIGNKMYGLWKEDVIKRAAEYRSPCDDFIPIPDGVVDEGLPFN